MARDIRQSPIAGQWYPGAADTLRSTLESYIGSAPVEPYAALYGLLAPHAGLVYSGPVAGYAFRHLIGRRYALVVVIGPSHYPYPDPLLTTGHTAFETPLGQIPVANDMLDALAGKIDLAPVKHDREHSIEIELPFLQYTLGAFRLIPLAMLDQSYAAAAMLAAALVEVLAGQEVLYVASSDLSHFYDQSTANSLDRVVLDAVADYDAEGVITAEREQRGFACGRGAIAAVMLAARQQGATAATIEHYGTSGDVSGDMMRVVGYGAATFHN